MGAAIKVYQPRAATIAVQPARNDNTERWSSFPYAPRSTDGDLVDQVFWARFHGAPMRALVAQLLARGIVK